MGALCLHHLPILRAMGALGTCLRSRIRVLDGQTNVIQVPTRVSDGLLDVGYQWYRSEACGCTHWRTLTPISSQIRRIQPSVEARVWAKPRAGGRSAGGWRRSWHVSSLIYASQQAPSSSHGLGMRACIPGHTGMWAHGVMSLHYNIGTHQSQPHTRSSGGVLVPHSAPQGTWMAREHPTWSWRPKQPKWFWRSRPPRSSNPHSCHQESDSKTVRCDGCNKRPANHLISPSSSEWLHVVAHGSVGAAQPAETFGTRLLLPKTPICT